MTNSQNLGTGKQVAFHPVASRLLTCDTRLACSKTGLWCLLLLATPRLVAGGTPGLLLAFTNSVDPTKTSGFLAVSNLAPQFTPGTKPVTNGLPLVTIFSWDRGNFVAESGISLVGPIDAPSLGRVLTGSGTWMGTNWDYQLAGRGGGYLSIDLKPSKEQEDLSRTLRGRSPALFRFEAFLARGMDYPDFITLATTANGEVIGMFAGDIPISGRMTADDATHSVALAWAVADLGITNINRVRLEAFAGGGFIPSRLETWQVSGGATNLKSAYVLLASGTNPLYRSLSPMDLYPKASLRERERDRLYLVSTNRRVEIPRRIHLEPTQHASHSKLLVRGILILVFAAAPIVWFLFVRRRSHGDQR